MHMQLAHEDERRWVLGVLVAVLGGGIYRATP